MKYIKSLILIIVICLTINKIYAQILEGEGLVVYQFDWNDSGLLPETRTGGLEPTTPAQADHLIIISDMVGATWDLKVQNAIAQAAGQTGTTIIFFPGGIYEFTQTIDLSYSNNHSNIIFQGAGSNATILQFEVGSDGTCFDIHGTCGGAYSIDNNINMYNTSFVCSSTTVQSRLAKRGKGHYARASIFSD